MIPTTKTTTSNATDFSPPPEDFQNLEDINTTESRSYVSRKPSDNRTSRISSIELEYSPTWNELPAPLEASRVNHICVADPTNRKKNLVYLILGIATAILGIVAYKKLQKTPPPIQAPPRTPPRIVGTIRTTVKPQ